MSSTTTTNYRDIRVTVELEPADLARDEVLDVLAEAFSHEVSLAQARRDEFLRDCLAFEARYNITSDEFLAEYAAGKMGDDADFVEWLFVKDAFDKWDRRYQILSAISL